MCATCQQAVVLGTVDVDLSRPPSLQLTRFDVQTQAINVQGWLQLCPPDLADTLGCLLHLGPVSGLSKPWHSPFTFIPQRGGGTHNTKWAPGQMGLRLSRGGSPHSAPTRLPLPRPAREGAPCQPQWGLSLCLAASQLLPWCSALNTDVCR